MLRKFAFAFSVLLTVTNACRQPEEKDPEQISRLEKRFFGAIGKKDLAGAMALWRADSPQFVSAREDLRRLFGPNRISLADGRLERTTFFGNDRARSYVSTDIKAFERSTGKPVDGFGRKNKLLDWVKEAGTWKISRYAPAEAELADALIAAKSADERARLRVGFRRLSTADLVRFLDEQAAEVARNGRPEDALRLSDLAIEAATSLDDHVALGWAYLRKAAILRDRSDNAVAGTVAQRGLELFLETRDRRGEAAARSIVGSIYSRRSDFARAALEFQASLNLAKAIPDRSIEAEARGGIGEVFRLTGNLDDALKSAEISLKIYRALADRMGESAELANTAVISGLRNQNEQALDLYRQCIAIDVDLHDQRGQGIDWSNTGTVLDAMSRYAEALEAYEKSMIFRRETGDRQGLALTLDNIGIVMLETGRFRQALAKFDESLALAVAINDRTAQADAVSNAGTAHQYLGEYGEALSAFQQSLRLERESHNSVGEAQSRATIAEVYSKAGRYRDALEMFVQTIPVFAQEGMKLEESESLHNIAEVYQQTGKYTEAAAGYAESLRIKRAISYTAGEVATLSKLAELQRIQGQFGKSIESAREGSQLAHKINHPLAEAQNMIAMADSLQLTGKSAEARKAYAEALQIAEKIGAQDAVAAAYTGLGSIHAAEHDWGRSAAHCEKAIEAVELMRSSLTDPSLQIGFFGLNQKPYHCLLSSQLALDRDGDALRTAERARARTLIEVLGRARVDIYEGLDAEDRHELQELYNKVEELEFALRQSSSVRLLQDLKTARRARDDFERVVYLKTPSLAVKRGGASSVNLADLKTVLPDSHAALLEYTLGEAESWLFVLRGPSRPGAPPLLYVHNLQSDRESIAKLVRSFCERLRKRGVEGSEGRQLYQLLLAPAKDELRSVSSLGIVPDGSLWLLPFAALREPDDHYLVESRAIYYAPSLTALTLMDRTREQRHAAFEARMRGGAPAFLLVGNPSFGASHRAELPLRGDFSELPETAAEVRGIAGLPGIRADILLGTDATEARVKQESGRYPVIHFATHGFYDSTNPMYSGILFSQTGDSKEDGFWEAREIAQQTLNTDLVVVSACDTARGEIFAGEGVMGLSWAFFAAGTPTSLLTTWQVNDQSTSQMMREFYRRWGIGDSGRFHNDKAVALQQSQKWMLSQKRYSDPYYWAPFVLIGTPR